MQKEQKELGKTHSILNFTQSASNKYYKYRLSLQGQCKIQETSLLRFSNMKTIFLAIPLMFTFFGLFCLKYSIALRRKVFYTEANKDQATHIFIKGKSNKQYEIVSIVKTEFQIYFYYKKLKYEIINNQVYPVGINYQKELEMKLNTQLMTQGLSNIQVKQRRQIYEANEHIVEAPYYFQYLYDVLTQPSFLIQYLAAFIYIIEQLYQIAALLLVASFFTTSINYVLLYISYKKIKQIAEKRQNVSVLRNGVMVEILSTQLVPGDLFVPHKQIWCDSILLKGQLYVNQSNLTGQSVPIGKFSLDNISNLSTRDTNMWLFEGSEILSSNQPLAMVINTGYSTKRGKILRKMLNKKINDPHFFKTFILFLVEMYAVAVVIYLGTLNVRIQSDNLDPVIIFLNFLLLITFCFPPSFPIYFNLTYSFCLLRLKNKNILGTQPQKTVESAHLKTLCFDKTGTLTEDKMVINKILKLSKQTYKEITNNIDNDECKLDYKLFGSCHTVKLFDDTLKGDQIDLKMFFHSGYKFTNQVESIGDTKFQVETKQMLKYNKLKILKIFQYESKFQSMSVLVYDYEANKFYIFAKGAPEIIHINSINKYSYFDDLLKDISHSGYRSIAYGFKQISESQKLTMLHSTRQAYLQNLQILGLVVFQNKLKDDAKQTIELLKTANIDSRMITGDNIFIAIETGIRCGIINRNEQILILEGREQQVVNTELIFNAKILKFENNSSTLVKQRISYEEYITTSKPIAIDNQFFKQLDQLNLSENIKIFARISPQNKANIIKKIKSEKLNHQKRLSKLTRLLRGQIDKVGMVGDGANDLLALKQADIGIGIKNCDSSYAASFTVEKLSYIDQIVRQSKCTERQIIQICRYVAINGFLNIPQLIVTETEASYYGFFQLIFLTLTKSIPFPILFGFSRPTEKQTIYKPCSNFLKLQNQLVVWGNAIILGFAYFAIMIYVRTVDQYIKGTSRATFTSGWTYEITLISSQYLFATMQAVILVFFVSGSQPWKQKIYQNVTLFIFFMLNLFFAFALYFITPQLKSLFSFVDLSYRTTGFVFLISMISVIIGIIYNMAIQSMKFHVRQHEQNIRINQVSDMIQKPENMSHQTSQV